MTKYENWATKTGDNFRHLQHLAIAIDSSSSFANYLKYQFIIWWARLMRGAVTIALSYNQVSRQHLKSITIEYVDSWVVINFCNLQLQFANSDKTLTEDSAVMITSTIIVVLFSTVVC